MQLQQIQECLNSSDIQKQLRGMTALRNHQPDVAVPLFQSQLKDKSFVVRSFAVMGLGRKRNETSFASLLEMIQSESDPNVRAETANSLSFYGEISVTHLVKLFHEDDHWLVRRSILAVLPELNCPQELLDVCACALTGEDATVKGAAIDCLGFLAETAESQPALELLLDMMTDQDWLIRVKVARALRQFNHPLAQKALVQLRQDPDHRVVASSLEALIDSSSDRI